MGRVMNSVGHDVVTQETRVDESPTLARQLSASLQSFFGENFSVQAAPAMEPVAIGNVTGLPPEAQRDFTDSMRTVLRVARIPVVERDGAVRADVAVALGPRQESGRPVTLKVTLLGGGGQKVLHTAEMKSMLVEPVTADQWKVLGEAAVFRVAENLRLLLGGGLRATAASDTLSITEGNTLKLDRRWTGPAPASTASP